MTYGQVQFGQVSYGLTDYGDTLTGSVGTVSAAGQTATADPDTATLPAGTGTVSAAGQSATAAPQPLSLAAGVATLTASGQAATADPDSVTLSRSAIEYGQVSYGLSDYDDGSVIVDGQSATADPGTATLPAGTGTVSAAGQTATADPDTATLTAAIGTLTAAGQSATADPGTATLTADVGTVSVTGVDAEILFRVLGPVEFVLDRLDEVVDDQPTDHPLKRVDRDASRIYATGETVDTDVGERTKTGELQEANFVGASLATRTAEPMGSEYDHTLETVVSVRIEALDADEYGHVDPDGVDAPQFRELVSQIRRELLSHRTFPNAGRSEVSFCDLRIQNESAQSGDYGDYYRYDFDIVFNGFEFLP